VVRVRRLRRISRDAAAEQIARHAVDPGRVVLALPDLAAAAGVPTPRRREDADARATVRAAVNQGPLLQLASALLALASARDVLRPPRREGTSRVATRKVASAVAVAPSALEAVASALNALAAKECRKAPSLRRGFLVLDCSPAGLQSESRSPPPRITRLPLFFL